MKDEISRLGEDLWLGLARFGALAVGVMCQIYRYWRVSGNVQPQQSKWIPASFAITARDEVDLEILSSSLMQVVVETLQPDRSWLWLRDIKQETNSSSTRQPNTLEEVDHKTSR